MESSWMSVKYMLMVVGMLVMITALFTYFNPELRYLSFPLGSGAGLMIGLGYSMEKKEEPQSVVKNFVVSEIPSEIIKIAVNRYPQLSALLQLPRGES